MTHPSRYELEQFFSNERKSPSVVEHVAQCVQCNQMVAQMRQEQESLLQHKPAAEFISVVANPDGKDFGGMESKHSGFKIPVLAWSFSMALLLCGVGYVFYTPSSPGQQTTEVSKESGLRWKGAAPVVEVFVNRDDEVMVSNDRVVLPGDRLQYRVTVPGGHTGFAALVALEDGKVDSIFPPDELGMPLMLTGSMELPGAVLIDEDTKALSLILVIRKQSFKMDDLLQAMSNEFQDSGNLENIEGVVSVRGTNEVVR